jgi:hypothetical protein
VLAEAAAERVQSLEPKGQELWNELREDAATDFQRACLEAALLAGHPLPLLHAFADAIRSWSDGPLAEACRPAPGEANQDPLRAFEQAGNALSPRSPPVPAPLPHRLLDLTGGVGPPRYGNVLDVAERGSGVVLGGARAPAGARRELGTSDDVAAIQRSRGKLAEDLLNAAGAPFELHFVESVLDTGGETLVEAVALASAALKGGTPVPVVLGGAKGELRRYALILQMDGEGSRRAFQLHDPFANETIWVNQRDLVAGRELPFEDRSLRRVTCMAVPAQRASG